MKTRTLLATGLLALTALLVIPPTPAHAAIQPPCGGIQNCIAPIGVCQSVVVPSDPLSQPTSFSCYGSPCGCNCPVVGAMLHIEAAGQNLDGTVVATCGGGASGSFTPGPVNAKGREGACVTPISYGVIRVVVEPICAFVDYATGCVTITTGFPVADPAPICALPHGCTFPPSGFGGVIGETIAYVETLATIWCQAAGAVGGEVGSALVQTKAYLISQETAAEHYLGTCSVEACQTFCSSQAATATCDLVQAAAQLALDQGNGQAGLLCDFLVGDSTCAGHVPGGAPAGTCPAPIPRGLPGAVGATLDYLGAACDSAQSGAAGAQGAVGTFAGAESASLVGFAGARASDAGAYAGAIASHAAPIVDAVTVALLESCGATTGFVAGQPCPL
jgi:hypothetical protein